jgi:hypothetical protein
VGVVLAAGAGVAHADVNSQLASLQAQVNQLQSQVNSSSGSSMGGMSNLVGTNSSLSWKMMSNYSGVGKEMNILKARQTGLSTLTVGGNLQADALYDYTNQNGANTYNFANPAINGANPSGSSTTRLSVTAVSLSTVASMGNWATGYIQVGKPNIGNQYDNVTGRNANGSRVNNLTTAAVAVQDAYMIFGNLSRMPVYGVIGYKDIDFGSFATVDMYNQPLTRTLFQAQGNTAAVGYNGYGFNGVASLINGGNHNGVTGINGAVQQENLSTSNNNNIGNFALNASYGMTNGMVNWNIGAGYLNGSQFTTYNAKTDGAWDLNAKVSAMGFDLLAEYDSTATKTNISSSANQKRAQAWDLGADYNFPVMGYKTVLNADYSQAYLAQGGSSQGYQYVLGYRVQPINNIWTGLEYAYSKNVEGYANSAGFNNTLHSALNGNAGVKNSTVTLDVTAMF